MHFKRAAEGRKVQPSAFSGGCLGGHHTPAAARPTHRAGGSPATPRDPVPHIRPTESDGAPETGIGPAGLCYASRATVTSHAVRLRAKPSQNRDAEQKSLE